MNDFVLLSGTANLPLALSIADILHTKLGDVEITRFIDSECRVQVKEDVAGKHVFVLQSLSQIADQHIIELSLIAEALQQLNVSSITAVIPFMGYSKQDKEFRKGEAVSAQLVARFIETAGFTKVITMELHSENLIPYFSLPLKELRTEEILSQAIVKKINPSQTVVLSPDQGGSARTELFAETLHLPLIRQSKKRNRVTGAITIEALSDSVNGKDVIIYDDIINTGMTAIETSKRLIAMGAASLYYVATHAVLAGNAAHELEKSSIKEVIVTDTVAIPQEKQFDRMRIISVAPLIADAITSKIK